MPSSTVPRARGTTLSLLSVLFLTGLLFGAQGAQASSSPSPSAAPVNPAISLTPSAGAGGSRIAVSGSGFAPAGTIALTVDGSSVKTSCTADANGNFSNCAFAVPPATAGTHTVTASDGSVSSASAIYTASAFASYTNPAPPASYTASAWATNTGNPTISLSSGAGKVGSNTAVSGSGFAAYSSITLAFDGSSVATSCKTRANGSFRYCALTVPAAIAGTHAVTASDGNANSAAASYTVNPAISLSPSAGAAGSNSAVSGSGYSPYSPITVTFDGSSVKTSCTADANGSFSNCALTVPAASAGSHTVTASDSKTDVASVGFYHSASASYTINPALSLSSTAGAVGSTVTLGGSNYTADSGLTVMFDGTVLSTSGTCTTSDDGNLHTKNACAFTVPTATAGRYSVTVSDGTYTGSATYTVNPAIGLTSSAGAGGSKTAVSGSGFASFGPITLAFDGSNVATSCTANASGSFRYCAFTVPAATGGPHTVTATDSSANAAQAGYTVNPVISLTSSAGVAGSSSAVSGSGFAPNAKVALSFDGNTPPNTLTCATNANGSFSPCAFIVPAATAGSHTVTVSDGNANSALAIYTVNPALSLSATAGAAGSTVVLSGSNYTPNSSVTVKFDGTLLGTSGTCTTNDNGKLPTQNACAFTVPAKTAGSYSVTVSDGTYAGSATYTVNTALSLTPNTGPVNSTATVSGSGFAPYSTITLTFEGTTPPNTPTCTADQTGSFSNCVFTVPSATVGPHTVGAADGSPNSAVLSNPYSAAASYVNYAWATYTVAPALSVSSPAGAVGSIVTLSGSNFKANDSLTITFDGTPLKWHSPPSDTCTADDKGNLPTTKPCAFIVPAVAAGPHTVTVSDSTPYSGTATFTVNPAVSLGPNAGVVGSTAAISGTGFAPNAPIALNFDSSSVPVTATASTPCTTDATGSFNNCTYIVPAKTAGIHPVTASDGTNSAAASYTVNPVLNLSSSTGPVLSSVVVSGTNFAPGAIKLTLDGTTALSTSGTCTADTGGNLPASNNCAFTVPATTAAGPHVVWATDSSGNIAKAPYTV